MSVKTKWGILNSVGIKSVMPNLSDMIYKNILSPLDLWQKDKVFYIDSTKWKLNQNTTVYILECSIVIY